MRRGLVLSAQAEECYRALHREGSRCLSQTTWPSLERCVSSDLICGGCREWRSRFLDEGRACDSLFGDQSPRRKREARRLDSPPSFVARARPPSAPSFRNFTLCSLLVRHVFSCARCKAVGPCILPSATLLDRQPQQEACTWNSWSRAVERGSHACPLHLPAASCLYQFGHAEEGYRRRQ